MATVKIVNCKQIQISIPLPMYAELKAEEISPSRFFQNAWQARQIAGGVDRAKMDRMISVSFQALAKSLGGDEMIKLALNWAKHEKTKFRDLI